MDDKFLTPPQLHFVEQQRVGRMATAGADGRPHIIPVCFAYTSGTFYIALDAKPKRVAPTALRRVRNIVENPHAALVLDHYSDDWQELAYLLIRGKAGLVPPEDHEQHGAIRMLRGRYPQYVAMPIESQPVIALRVGSVVAWGALD